MHGLGPHSIVVAGKKTTARQAMQELSSALEEAKADVSGLFALQYMVDHGIRRHDDGTSRCTSRTWPAYSARSASGSTRRTDREWRCSSIISWTRGRSSITRHRALFGGRREIQGGGAEADRRDHDDPGPGNYEGANSCWIRYAVIRPALQRTLDRLAHLPVDIEPQFQPT
jgi:hypothetical protein